MRYENPLTYQGIFLFVMDNGWSGLWGNWMLFGGFIREVRILVGKSVGLDYFENDYHLEWDLDWGVVEWIDFVGKIEWCGWSGKEMK